LRPTIDVGGSETRVLVEQAAVVDPQRLGRSAGRLDAAGLRAVDEALELVLGLLGAEGYAGLVQPSSALAASGSGGAPFGGFDGRLPPGTETRWEATSSRSRHRGHSSMWAKRAELNRLPQRSQT
jgi:hypothetical protein